MYVSNNSIKICEAKIELQGKINEPIVLLETSTPLYQKWGDLKGRKLGHS